MQAIVRGVTERTRSVDLLRHEAERSSLLLELYENSQTLTDKQLYDFVLEHAVSITESEIGFLHMVSEDQKTIHLTTWNGAAMES